MEFVEQVDEVFTFPFSLLRSRTWSQTHHNHQQDMLIHSQHLLLQLVDHLTVQCIRRKPALQVTQNIQW